MGSEADKIIHERSNKASEKYQNHVKHFLEKNQLIVKFKRVTFI